MLMSQPASTLQSPKLQLTGRS